MTERFGCWSKGWASGVLLAVVAVLIGHGVAWAGEATIAVAANFQGPARALADAFEERSEHRVRLSFGSTGQLYAQIHSGAPFDAFFAADAARPTRLEQVGASVPGSRFTYAEGRLVLWSSRAGYIQTDELVLRQGDFAHLAIADPRLAPYGAAAEQTLRALGLWQALQSRLVTGESISQTYQYVATGAAALGFVALSQVQRPGREMQGSAWIVPDRLHQPIEQQAVLLQATPAARAFMEFVQTPAAHRIIESFGYQLPGTPTD